jgi:hypothetical protein
MMFLVRCSWLKTFVVLGSLFLVAGSLNVAGFAANEEPRTKNQEQVAVPFRPENGKFPPAGKGGILPR